jgi:hypothetical protein
VGFTVQMVPRPLTLTHGRRDKRRMGFMRAVVPTPRAMAIISYEHGESLRSNRTQQGRKEACAVGMRVRDRRNLPTLLGLRGETSPCKREGEPVSPNDSSGMARSEEQVGRRE